MDDKIKLYGINMALTRNDSSCFKKVDQDEII